MRGFFVMTKEYPVKAEIAPQRLTARYTLQWITTLLASWLILLLPVTASATSTQQVFSNSKGAIIQVRVLDVGSGAQRSIGSGFHVGNGYFITNYHVVADLLDQKKRLTTVAQTFDKKEFPLELITLDVIHDVAILRAKQTQLPTIALAATEPEHGQRLYSIGNPMDIGFTIVEGTYNGLVKDDPRGNIHFTGALNPGVSGGPTIGEDGTAIGINVASSGDEISYLVPIEHARALLSKLRNMPAAAPSARDLNQLVRKQLLAEQDRLTTEALATPFKQIRLAGFQVADTNVPWITCWGDSNRDKKKPLLHTSRRQCGSGSTVYISDALDTSYISYGQLWLDGSELSRAQFLYQYGKTFNSEPKLASTGESINPAVCQNDFFRKGRIVFRGSTCIQTYRDYTGIYNIRFHAATQGQLKAGLITTLTLNGFSLSNAKKLMAHYLNAFKDIE